MRRRLLPLALVAGTLVPAISASGVSAQSLPTLTTTTTTTTTTTSTTTTTTMPASTTTTTTTATSTTATSSTTTTTAVIEDEVETQTLVGGSLSISTPAATSLPSRPTGGSTISAPLGVVTVTDSRGAGSTWSATVTSSTFTTGAGTPPETIARTHLAYWSGPVTELDGNGSALPGQLSSVARVTLTQARAAFSGSVVLGEVAVSWNPTLVVDVPATAVVGVYQGTITHSVA